MNEKSDLKNLTASQRSPVIPQINNNEKAKIAKAQEKAEKLEKEKDKAKKPNHSEAKEEPEPAKPTFPAESHLNPYGFIFMRKKWLEELKWARGAKVIILKNPDNSITVRKA